MCVWGRGTPPCKSVTETNFDYQQTFLFGNFECNFSCIVCSTPFSSSVSFPFLATACTRPLFLPCVFLLLHFHCVYVCVECNFSEQRLHSTEALCSLRSVIMVINGHQQPVRKNTAVWRRPLRLKTQGDESMLGGKRRRPTVDLRS